MSTLPLDGSCRRVGSMWKLELLICALGVRCFALHCVAWEHDANIVEGSSTGHTRAMQKHVKSYRIWLYVAFEEVLFNGEAFRKYHPCAIDDTPSIRIDESTSARKRDSCYFLSETMITGWWKIFAVSSIVIGFLFSSCASTINSSSYHGFRNVAYTPFCLIGRCCSSTLTTHFNFGLYVIGF